MLFRSPESLGVLSESDAGQVPGQEHDPSFAMFILRRLQKGTTTLSAEVHQHLDRLLLRLVLRHTRGNQVQAARVLGISRQTLRSKTREFGIDGNGSTESDEDEEV